MNEFPCPLFAQEGNRTGRNAVIYFPQGPAQSETYIATHFVVGLIREKHTQTGTTFLPICSTCMASDGSLNRPPSCNFPTLEEYRALLLVQEALPTRGH